MKRFLRIAVAFLLVAIGTAHAATFTVTSTADAGAGSLRDAIAQANLNPGPDTINFSVTGTIALTSGTLFITSGPLTIAGPGAANLTIAGNQTFRLMSMHEGAGNVTCPDPTPPPDYLVTISGVTLKDGNRAVTDSQGGAIFSTTSLSLDGVVVRDNVARGGGGVTFSPRSAGQSLTIANSSFINNRAKPTAPGNTLGYAGGALLVADFCFGLRNPATLTIVDSIFSGNRSQPDVAVGGNGGAMAIYGNATATITRTRITNNGIDRPNPLGASNYPGGGIFASTSSVTVIDSEISDNFAHNSGGLAINADTASLQSPADTFEFNLVNSTVSGNTAYNSGGAMLLYGNLATEIHNSTIADNVATNGTSGVHLSKPSTAGTWLDPTLTLSSSAVGQARGGTDDLSANVAVIPATTVTATNSLVQRVRAASNITVTGTGNMVGTAPLLGALSFNGGSTRTMAMLAGSPILDTGSNPLNLTTDQRGPGYPRTAGAGTDMGAMEGPGLCAGFTDVLSTNSFCPNVEWLKNRAITLGCTSTSVYCPTDPVTRLSMAAFMNRLGVALTPRKQFVEGTPGAFVMADTAAALPTLVCVSGDFAPATHGRSAIVNTTFSGLSDANTISYRGALLYSTDSGTTWQVTPTQSATRISAAGDQWSDTALSTLFPMTSGLSYRFAMGIRRDNIIAGTLGNFVQSFCQLDAAVVNVNGIVPPFDAQSALDGTRP